LLPLSWFGDGAPGRSSLPILLVHGLVWDIEGEDQTWGCCTSTAWEAKWDGMVGFLESHGQPFGGTIHIRNGGRPTAVLDSIHATARPDKAGVFIVQCSANANTDGLAYKTLELAEAIRLVCQMTGAPKVRIVAHSAGGLVARAYLQNALPGVSYRGDVDRLITIGTPHLGSSLATHFGDFLGTRATSLKPDAALIGDLNNTLDLPSETTFASIVVRGVGADDRGEGSKLESLVDKDFLERLPVEYRLGGDQVVHVRSQNLRLARCAARYEQKTGRPIQYVLARVPDPSSSDWLWKGETVHVAATRDKTVEELALALLGDDIPLWRKAADKELTSWIDWQAQLHVCGAIEAEALREHPLSQVSQWELDQVRMTNQEGYARTYAFQGKAYSRNRLVSLRQRWTEVRGTVEFHFDSFGRVLTSETRFQ
jgi:pimeloyl-ACP methyl ester carboxylesterase